MKKSAFPIGGLAVICFLCGANLRAQFTAGHIALSGDDMWNTTNLPANAPSFMWYPGQAALRFGYFDSTSASMPIGQYSIAGGYGVRATNSGCIALGVGSQATYTNAIALGYHSYASGEESFAVGGGGANGPYSTAIGRFSGAMGQGSVAIGYWSRATAASGDIAIGTGSATTTLDSIAIGSATITRGVAATAIGKDSQANGDYSIALGGGWAAGNYSFSVGPTMTQAYGGAVVGTNNFDFQKDGVSYPAAAASPEDPVFQVGNGDSVSNGPNHDGYSNALTVYRDGTIRMYKACGGISMGIFQ